MIPILYEKDETVFASNGLGRLRDCISCKCVEERNSIYEVDFEYPLSGAHYEDIKLGRIIGVTHDDTGDVQPFDIVSYSKPINGVVTFHCTHISYRQSYLTVTGSNINTLADAFTLLSTAEPSNPFSYQTDKTSTGYLGSADGVPKSVRSMLGGIEGSILDIYGGEYEWNRWSVILHQSRGQLRDFSIRYGVNMLDYQDETDSSGTYSSVIPYWTDGTTTVVGDRQDATNPTITGRGECVPLDVSDRFESQPTKAQVEAMGLSVLNSQNAYLPTQNISVSFVRLQDMPEYAGMQNLLRCGLCDTIKVIFPDYNSSGQFKIVKTVWDVLADRYEEMELGDLSISLSEALGISDVQKDSRSTVEQIIERVDDISTAIQSLAARQNIKMATGYIDCGTISANSYKDVTFNYSSAGFGSNPTVLATLNSSGTAANIGSVCVAVSSYNATTATIRVFNNRSSTIHPYVICAAFK